MARFVPSSVIYPGQNVMLGRGGESNYHCGNLSFRRFAETYKERYKQASKVDKPVIAAEVVAAWRNLEPPGRFLTRTDSSTTDSRWYDVGDAHAVKRATKTLGERSQRERRSQKATKMKKGGGQVQRSSSAPSSPCSLYTTESFLRERESEGNMSSRANDTPWDTFHEDMAPGPYGDATQQQMQSNSHVSGSRDNVDAIFDDFSRATGLALECPTAPASTLRTSQSKDSKTDFCDGFALQDRSERNNVAPHRKTRSWPSQQETKVQDYLRGQDATTCAALWSNLFGGPVDTSSIHGNDAVSAVWDSNLIDTLSAPPNEDNNDLASLDFTLTGAGIVAASVPTAAFLAQCAFENDDEMIFKKSK